MDPAMTPPGWRAMNQASVLLLSALTVFGESAWRFWQADSSAEVRVDGGVSCGDSCIGM